MHTSATGFRFGNRVGGSIRIKDLLFVSWGSAAWSFRLSGLVCVCVFFGLEFRAPIVRTPGRFVPWPYTKLPALVETLSGRIRIWGLGFGVYRGLGVQGLRV